MRFGVVGISYKNADMDIRDRTTFTDQSRIDFLQEAGNKGIEQCMVLSTCNRSEVYFFYDSEEMFDAALETYKNFFPEVDLTKYLICLKDREALSYLFRVASGLESMVLGEDQIKGQVMEALDFARTMGFCGKELDKVVRDAISCSKRIKTELRISEKPLSVSYVGIQKLKELTGIEDRTILVIGSGRTAVLALKYLYEYSAGHVIVCSRTLSKAKGLRNEYPEMEVVEYEKRYEAMKRCDIVISATSSPHLVIRRDDLTCVRPMTFLDLAAPRDIDTGIAELPEMKLINLDTLREIVEENRKERERLVEAGQVITEQCLNDTMDWFLTSRMDSTIESLQQRCGEIVEDSYTYLNRKIDLSKREQQILRKVLNASLQRLLHEPIQELKKLDTGETQARYQQMIKQLFQI